MGSQTIEINVFLFMFLMAVVVPYVTMTALAMYGFFNRERGKLRGFDYVVAFIACALWPISLMMKEKDG